jgi:class 3 adenylate cyclase/tetratricopeptide (TPR) repeat protein
MLSMRESLEGERKQVSVLFADLKSSLELLADRDPEEARQILDPVLESLMEAVHHYEGTVNQVLGDGIMALFGAPLAHEDHALRACYAALRMQDSVRRYVAGIAGLTVPVRIRVGINSGEVVVRAIGSDLHMDYSAVGQTTHLAARMEQLAQPGGTLLTRETLQLVQGQVTVQPTGPLLVKGLADPLEAFELIGPGQARSRLQAAAMRGLTRFVGRETELAMLRRTTERAGAGHGQIVCVIGEPGVGKSRLVHEFIHTHLPPPWRVIEAATVSYGRATPYRPIVALLRDYFQIEDGDDAVKVLDKVGSRIRGLDDTLASGLPVVLSLLDVPVADDAWDALDPTQRRRRTLELLRHLFLRESQAQPLCLVLEDLHWIDSESQSLLDRLIESLPTARILCLVSSRPEFEHDWTSKSYYTQISLEPLAPGLAQALLDTLLGGDPALDPLRAQLIERTEGNPFFLEESVWHLVETGALAGERGAYRPGRPVREAQVPATVHAVLAARIDRLPAAEKRLLQAAAVIGKDVPLLLLAAVSDLSEDQLRVTLRRLQSAELLYEVPLFPAPEYTFKHALTFEVAAASVLRERRRALDARIVETLEALGAEPRADQVERLAHHALRGEVWDKALTYCRQAGARAFARSAHRAAVEWFERALAALTHLPETPQSVGAAIDLRLDLRSSLSPLAEFPRMQDHLQEAEGLAEAAGDRRRQGLVAAFLTNFYTVMLEFRRAIEYGQRAVAIAADVRDVEVQVLAHTFLGLARYGQGDYRAAVDLARRNVTLLRGDLVRERFGMAVLPAVYSRTVLVWSLAELGEFDDGLTIGQENIRMAEAAEHPYSIVFSRFGLGALHLRQGDLARAVAELESALARCRSADIRAPLLNVVTPLCSAYAQSGRIADARKLVDEAVDVAVAMGDPLGHWLRTGVLAEIHLAAGQVEDALPLARRAVELTRYIKSRGSEAWALRLLGEAEASQPTPLPDEAQATYRQALARGLELEMRPLQARCHLGLGTLAQRLGHEREAQAEIQTARDLFRAIGMEYWRTRAESVLAADPAGG